MKAKYPSIAAKHEEAETKAREAVENCKEQIDIVQPQYEDAKIRHAKLIKLWEIRLAAIEAIKTAHREALVAEEAEETAKLNEGKKNAAHLASLP